MIRKHKDTIFLLVAVVFLAVISEYAGVNGYRTYRCSYQERYASTCRLWNWQPHKCTKYRTKYKDCVYPQHGRWTSWSSWSYVTQCQTTLRRTRSCTNPKPAYGGRGCSGSMSEQRTIPCNVTVDGGWSAFSGWTSKGSCSTTCGKGKIVMIRSRSCTNPQPQDGGKECSGSSTEERKDDCFLLPCPVDGGWSDWSDWQIDELCSAACGGGKANQHRTRNCTNPKPAHRGKPCSGDSRQDLERDCNTNSCGARCPDTGAVKFEAVPSSKNHFYQCDNGVLRLMSCPPGQVWTQDPPSCGGDSTTFSCEGKSDGYYVYPGDPTKYIMCSDNRKFVRPCPAGLVFDSGTIRCIRS